jgi:hypothetical protein
MRSEYSYVCTAKRDSMKYIYLFLILSFAGITLTSNRSGRASSQSLGSTGAPKEQTVCKSCHNGPIDVSLSLHLLDGSDTVATYEPGKNYTIRVLVNHIGGNVPRAYGFQLTGLNAALNVDGPNIKSIAPGGSNVKVATAQNRLYAEHNDRSTTNQFDVNWTAPSEGSGPVTFYAAGNGVNSDNNLTGDGSAKISVQFNERSVMGTNRFSQSKSISLYPNPASETSMVKDETGMVHRIVIRDLFGKEMKSEILDAGKKTISLGEFVDGVYMAQFFSKDGQLLKTQRLIKRQFRP